MFHSPSAEFTMSKWYPSYYNIGVGLQGNLGFDQCTQTARTKMTFTIAVGTNYNYPPNGLLSYLKVKL